MSPSLQEQRLTAFLDQVPHSDRWEINLIPDQEGNRTTWFTPQCLPEYYEAEHFIENIAATKVMPFSRYSLPKINSLSSSEHNSRLCDQPSKKKRKSIKPDGEHIADLPQPPPPSFYYTPRKGAPTICRMVEFRFESGDKGVRINYPCGNVDFKFPDNITPSDRLPSVWDAHEKHWATTTEQPWTWKLYHQLMTAYISDTILRNKNREVLHRLRSICMCNLISYAIDQYRVGDRMTPPKSCTHEELISWMKDVYSHHKSWLFATDKLSKPEYLHFMDVYDRDIYLPVETRNYCTHEIKGKRIRQHNHDYFTGKLEYYGEPFMDDPFSDD